MKIEDWVVVKSEHGNFICMSQKHLKTILKDYELKDPVIEKYDLDQHYKYVLKIK